MPRKNIKPAPHPIQIVMSETNEQNELPAGGASADNKDTAPAKARRNVRRTPRKKIDDEAQLLLEPAPAAPRRPRQSRRSVVQTEDVVLVGPVSAPHPANEISDELSAPVIIVPPRRPTPEPDVPVRFSTDDDEGPAPARDESRGGDDEDAERGPGSKAQERRRERRLARMGGHEEARRDEQAGAKERKEERPEPQDGDERYDPRIERDRQQDREMGAEGDEESGYDSSDGERDSESAYEQSDDSGDRGDEDSDDDEDSSDADGEDAKEGEAGRTNGRSGETPSNQRQDRGQQGRHDNRPQQDRNGQYGQGQYNDRRQNKKQKFKQKQKKPGQGGGQYGQPQQGQQRQPVQNGAERHGGQQPNHQPQRGRVPQSRGDYYGREETVQIEVGELPEMELLRDVAAMDALAAEQAQGGAPVDLIELLTMNLHGLIARSRDEFSSPVEGMPVRSQIVEQVMNAAWDAKRPIVVEGIVETTPDGYGLLTYQHENYRVKPLCSFVPRATMRRYGLKRGCIVKAQVAPPRRELTQEGNRENCPAVLKVESVMGRDPLENLQVTPFEDLTPYYPTERLILETGPEVKWDNVSMRVVDLLTPVGKGQRGLIVAPPRTGKTILQQGIANAVMKNNPEAHLIILLVDERPEEVTDFRRQITKGEVIASTFDENAESHVHAAEMVIEKARRMVEVGRHVIILLDSITRLGRAYNTLAANSGKILSGGVEATALQKPKRFFGSARNIEGGGSLTILGTALVETGSRMDEVIFEEFKGTGNMELVLDRAMVDKRIFPSINLEKSGTRKEELLYHPDELVKVYGLRRAMKGVPSPDAMEMLITRVKKTRTNIEFLMGLNR